MVTLSPTVASLQVAKPGYVYGAPSILPLQNAASIAQLRVGMPSDIPANATITSALVVLSQYGDFTGTNVVQFRRITANWAMSTANWNNAAAYFASVSASVSKTTSLGLTAWSFDVTADVQGFVSGTTPNYGWRISTTSSSLLKFRGSTASANQPTLVITYMTPSDAPDSLTPDGNSSVSVAKPVLQFQVPPDTVSINVQIDPAFSAPTNLLSDAASNMETGIAAWTAAGTPTPALTNSSAQAYEGTKSLLITWAGSTSNPQAQATVTGLTIGLTYTAFFNVYVPTGDAGVIPILGTATGSTVTAKDAWTPCSVSFVASATSHIVAIRGATPANTDLCYVDGVRVSLGSAIVPGYDSGEIVAAAGELDLSTTNYVGLTAGTSTYWRARAKSALGWSAFSDWAQFSRTAKIAVTITSPGATADDSTPPVIWTAPGQTSWRVIFTSAAGKVLSDSGRIVGTALTWTPPKAVAAEGQTATIEVRAWDSVDRVATAGDPTYATASQTYTLQGSGAVSGALTCVATSDGVSPRVAVTATRGSAPDKWTLIRDGVRLATSTTTGTPFTMYDWTADPNKAHIYRMAPVITATGTSTLGPTATITPTCTGIWLVDPDNTNLKATIWGTDSGSWDAVELAIIHQPIAGAPIRRVAYRPPLSGSISGDLVDALSLTADDQITSLYDFKSDDRDLRLVMGDRNLLVRVGDILVTPTPESDADRHSLASFTWWQQGDTPWTP